METEQAALSNILKSQTEGGAATGDGAYAAGADVPKVLAEDAAKAQLLQESVYTQTGQVDKAIASSVDYNATKPAPSVVTSDAAATRNTENQTSLNTYQTQLQESNTTGTSGNTTTKTASPTTGTTDGEVDPLKAKIDAATSAIDNELAQATSLLDSRMASLNGANQAQIENIKRIFAARKEETRQLNEVLLQSNTKAGIRAGRNRYAPEINSGILTGIEQQGIARLAALDAQELDLISQAQAANDANQFNLLSQKLQMVSQTRREKDATIAELNRAAMEQEKFAMEKAMQMRQFQRFDREDAGASIDAMVKAGLDPASIPPEYLNKLDAQAGYIAGTSTGLMNVAMGERKAKSVSDFLDQQKKIQDVLSTLPPDQMIEINGNQYYGSRNDWQESMTEIEKSTGNLISVFTNKSTGEQKVTVQKGVLKPNIEYTIQETKNSDGSTSKWYVPVDPTQGPAIPVSGQQFGGAQGVNSGEIEEKFPDGSSWNDDPAGWAEKGLSAKDFWCLRFVGNMDVRGQALMNEVGNTLAEKRASVEKDIGYGAGQQPPQAGDYILTNEDSTYGHIALIKEIRTDPDTGKEVAILTESNYKPLTVTHTRSIQLDSNRILGFKKSQLKPEYTSQPESPQFGDAAPNQDDMISALGRPKDSKYLADVDKLYGNISLNPAVKSFPTRQEAYNTATSVPDTASNAQQQISLVYSYMKLLDPESVVREGEFATAQKYDSALRQLGVRFDNLSEGKVVSDEVIKNMKSEVARMYEQAADSYQSVIDSYTRQAEQYRIDADDLLVGLPSVSGSDEVTARSLSQKYPQYSQAIQGMIAEGYSLDEIQEAINGI